jgi:hypothetical protein
MARRSMSERDGIRLLERMGDSCRGEDRLRDSDDLESVIQLFSVDMSYQYRSLLPGIEASRFFPQTVALRGNSRVRL